MSWDHNDYKDYKDYKDYNNYNEYFSVVVMGSVQWHQDYWFKSSGGAQSFLATLALQGVHCIEQPPSFWIFATVLMTMTDPILLVVWVRFVLEEKEEQGMKLNVLYKTNQIIATSKKDGENRTLRKHLPLSSNFRQETQWNPIKPNIMWPYHLL